MIGTIGGIVIGTISIWICQFIIWEHKDCKTKTIYQSDKGDYAILLLYKDARCDMNVLDETVKPYGWQRKHDLVNGKEFCTVSIYDEATAQWISKQDCGTKSNTEEEKGESSDAFKRACFNWGIGRELYTAPFIYLKLEPNDTQERNNKKQVKSTVKFYVSKIEYADHKIKSLEISDKKGVRWTAK